MKKLIVESSEKRFMNNKECIEWIRDYNIKKFQDDSDEMILALLEDSDIIYEEEVDARRWWNDMFYVVKIDGKYIGFDGAETTGDNSPSDVGWEFDMESICEVEKRVEIKEVVTFVPKKHE